MPATAPLIKINATRDLGAEVILSGEYYDEAFAKAPVTSGPFKFVDWKAGARVILADLPNAQAGVIALVAASEELGREFAAWLNDLEKRGRLKGCRSTAGESPSH